ncbi:MAG: FliM/FliN family flagellar motor switch protein [Candidatus Hydrogenedentes bacterium]|nr:FliM/FliN family flagellar motor switch protein [Candidatus Hydrogenedentota bacterium]
MMTSRPTFREQPQDHQFARELSPTQPSAEHLVLDDLKNVKLIVTAELGVCRLSIRDIMNLKRGSVLSLSKLAGEMADIQVNGIPLAKGEVVVLGDVLNVRVAEIQGATDKDTVND